MTPPPDDTRGRLDADGGGLDPEPEPVDFEDLYQRAPCAYLTTRDDGTILGVNDTFLRWTGHERAAIVGSRLQKLFPVGDQVMYSTHCQPMLSMVGAVAEIAIEVVGADRQRRPALLSAAREPATDLQPARVRVVIFSAHERRAYEKELLSARRRAEESEVQRADAEAYLQHHSLHDALTGLPNRVALVAYLDAALAESSRVARQLGVLVVGLDHFRLINDSLGRAAGDELLLIVTERLRASVRDAGMVARLAGDKFVVVCPITDDTETGVIAGRLLDALRQPVTIDDMEIVTSASIGAALGCPGSETAERLLRNADGATYLAKARGRNTWQLHDPTTPDPAADRLRLVGELRSGIRSGELRVHYQPRVDVRTRRVHSVEALVRWQHPTRGLLSPLHFIEVAEESGLIRALGARVLEDAVVQAVRWHAASDTTDTTDTTELLEMSVNLSPRQLVDPHLVDVVTSILDRHGLDPVLLTLEITETALMTDPDAALSALTALKRLGVRLAVDDFGTGYSSLTYLKQFPVDELKIDQSFTAGLGTSQGDSAIVASCVQLAHALGMRAVAEGVETERQHAALIDLRCDLAQGYHYSRPLSAEDFSAWAAGQQVVADRGLHRDLQP